MTPFPPFPLVIMNIAAKERRERKEDMHEPLI